MTTSPEPPHAPPRTSTLRIVLFGAIVLVSVALFLWTGLYLTGGLHDPADWVVSGVSLGMTPKQTQTAFKDAPYGEWATKTGCDGIALEWTRRPTEGAAKTPVTWARMEVHEGLLVAYRVKLDHRTRRHRIEVMSAAVREERATADGESITLLSRACPTHQAEAEQIALRHS